jgi:hypothetical protein
VLPFARVDCPRATTSSLDGIISWLTRKHGGHPHDARVVRVISKAVAFYPSHTDVGNLPLVQSGFQPSSWWGHWICFDFDRMRVLPTHYTLRAWGLKSWVVETSVDGLEWDEVDRQTDNTDFKHGWKDAPFTIQFAEGEARFVRLTQMSANHSGNDQLRIRNFELFGSLFEEVPKSSKEE